MKVVNQDRSPSSLQVCWHFKLRMWTSQIFWIEKLFWQDDDSHSATLARRIKMSQCEANGTMTWADEAGRC